MYDVDDRDEVAELTDAPRPDVGAPMPHLVCDESRTILAYLVREPAPTWPVRHLTMVDRDSDGYPVAVVRFERPYAHLFGPPNDEAFAGHPLAARGLGPYAVYEVRQSSWLRRLERMNSVHQRHDREQFLAGRRHFVFAFHDSTFECIAHGFRSRVVRGPLRAALPDMLAALDDGPT